VILVDLERFVISLNLDGMTGAHVDGRLELLFELDGQGLLQRLEATAAGLRLYQAQVGAHEHARLCRQQLDGTGHGFWSAILRFENAFEVVLPGCPDAFLQESGYIEEHGISRIGFAF
jgi:hypothetical protein